MVASANAMLTREAVAGLRGDEGLRERFAQPGSLVDIAVELLGWGDAEVEYLRSVPEVLQEAMRGVLVASIDAGKPVTLQYSPAYDFEVRVWDYGDGVSLHLAGPYPPAPREAFLSSSQ